MKKNILLYTLCFGLLLGWSSCKDQCIVCDYQAGAVGVTIEKCGSRGELKDFEKMLIESADVTRIKSYVETEVICIRQ